MSYNNGEECWTWNQFLESAMQLVEASQVGQW